LFVKEDYKGVGALNESWKVEKKRVFGVGCSKFEGTMMCDNMRLFLPSVTLGEGSDV